MSNFIKNNLKLIAVSVGHFTNDFFMNLIPPILLIFTEELGLSLTQQALIVTVLTTSGTLLQPVIGFFLDKIGRTSMLTISVIWISVGMSLTGIIDNYVLLLIIVGIAGMASSVYHPLGSAIAANLSEGSHGKSLSVFMTIGGFAAMFTPIIAVPMTTHFGRGSLIFLMVPGLLAAYFLKQSGIHSIKYIPDEPAEEKEKVKRKINRDQVTWMSWVVLIGIFKVTISRILIAFGVQIMMLKGLDFIMAGVILSAHLFARTIGTLSGGFMSDKFGEKKIMVFFNGLSLLGYMLMTFTAGWVSAIGFVVVGYTLNATATANITITHRILPNNLTFGTGMIMGFSSTVAGIAILGFGFIADGIGLLDTAQLFNILIFGIIIISVMLPNRYAAKLIEIKEESNVC
jgi:FSR family fosmidomycin resistance protein-like MFS transporter